MSEKNDGPAEIEPTEALNAEERLSLLDKEEKLILLVGVFMFYGTRRVSEKKIAGLQLILRHLHFDSEHIIHRDPSDEELTFAETTAWVLDVLKSNFADESMLPDEAVEPLLRTIMRSLNQDLKKEPDPELKATRIIEGLEKLASLEGKISANEKKLIGVVKSECKFISGPGWFIFGLIAVGGALATSLTVLDDRVLAFSLVVLVASTVSGIKWCARFLSRAFL